MNELDPGARRAADRLSQRLKSSRDGYLEALLELVPYVEESARAGDERAQVLLEDVERARVLMVSENMNVADVLD